MDGTNTSLDETSEGLATTQTDKKVAMQWDETTSQEREPIFEFGLAPNQWANNQEGAGSGPISNQSPMAMTYDSKLRWVVKQLGPKSGHYKRLARGVKSKPA